MSWLLVMALQRKSWNIWLISETKYRIKSLLLNIKVLCEKLWTPLTNMSFVTSMSSFMNYQMLSLHKHCVTVGTLIILYPSVKSHTIFIYTIKSEEFTTLLTLIRYLISVFCRTLWHLFLYVETLTTEAAKVCFFMSWVCMFIFMT